MATTGYSTNPTAAADSAVTTSTKVLTEEVQRLRRQLASLDADYVTDENIENNHDIADTELQS